MFDITRSAQASALAKWLACALILLAPGSFVVLPLMWLARQWAARGTALARSPEARAAKALVTQSTRGA